MKTCKGFWLEDSCLGGIPKKESTFLIGKHKVFNAVPLSEFEAYKAKTKQAINSVLEEYNWDLQGQNSHDKLNAKIAIQAIEKIIKKLEL